MKNLERIRWRTRRGLLELDILLESFVKTGYIKLDETERVAFETLLDLPDNTLLDLLMGKTDATSPAQKILLDKISAA